MTSTLKHSTASVFLFDGPIGSGQRFHSLRLGLIYHPRLELWMVPGGHVEPGENCAEAAVREVLEETGRRAELLSLRRDVYPAPQADRPVPVPLWIVEQDVPPEKRLPEAHIHVDHLYVAEAESKEPSVEAELDFRWVGAGELGDLAMFDGTRTCAYELFTRFTGRGA